MDAAALSLQQVNLQTSLGQQALRQQAKSDQAVVGLVQQAVQQSSPAGARGQNLDITV